MLLRPWRSLLDGSWLNGCRLGWARAFNRSLGIKVSCRLNSDCRGQNRLDKSHFERQLAV